MARVRRGDSSRSKKHPSARGGTSAGSSRERLNRDTLLKRLGAGPAAWGELKRAFPGDPKALRKLLRGLTRNGDINQSDDGRLFYVGELKGRQGDAKSSVEGLVKYRNRRPYLEAQPIIDPPPQLRSGDRVSALRTADGVRVLEVLAPSREPVVGRVLRGRRGWYVEALSRDFRGTIDVDAVAESAGDFREGDTVSVALTGAGPRGPTGQLLSIVARRDEGTAALAATSLLTSQGVPTEWPQGVEAAARALPAAVQPARFRSRVDLTTLPLVTIDGEDARDFDDAVFCQRDGRGWRLVVAIADVAHYVRAGQPLDSEARIRGNSVYLPDRVVPMLPEALSNGLCSLRPNEAKLVLVCDMHVTARGELASFRMAEAVMRSWQRLTYTQVAGFLGGDTLAVEPEVVTSLRALHRCFQALLKARERRGGLDFEGREVKLVLRDGELDELYPYQRNDAHRMIEEAMIAANVCAARFIEGAQARALYRVHEAPAGEKLERLRQTLAMVGVRATTDALTPQRLKKALAQLAEHPLRSILELLVLRAMQQARYGPENSGHFGLALEEYMHFTSPIRRYADLVVHRVIKRILKTGGCHRPGFEALLELGEHISMTERRAEDVERGVSDWLKCEALRGRIGDEFDGQIVAVTEFGAFVELEGAYVQGLLHVSALGEDFFRYFDVNHALVGDRSGQTYTLGDRLRVVLEGVKPERGQVDLSLLEAPRRRKKR